MNKSLWLNAAPVSWSHVIMIYKKHHILVAVPPSITTLWDFLRTELECESLTALTRSYGKSRIKRLAHCSIGILLPKLFWPTVGKNCSSDREKILKFEVEGREFAKIISPSLEQFIQTVKGQNNFCFFNLFLEVSKPQNVFQFEF